VLSAKQTEHFKHILETRISELNHALATAEQETRAGTARQADPVDQAASEYERQSFVRQAAAARQMLKTLTQALARADTAEEFRRVRRMRRRHRTKKAGSHSVGAVLRQMSRRREQD